MDAIHDSLEKKLETLSAMLEAPPDEDALFLVCGLGSLGQFCVAALREFGVRVSAIDQTLPPSWEIDTLPDEIQPLLMGDCRQSKVLERAGVQQCRAVLLVTSDERINLEAAFAVRLLNPQARIVVRSAKQNLNDLCATQLGNFVAFEATQLPAPAFAIAALGSEMRGFIHLDDYLLQVVKVPIGADHRWCDRRRLHELNSKVRRLLSHIPVAAPLPGEFHQWDPEERVRSGDQVAYIEIAERLPDLGDRNSASNRNPRHQRWQAWKGKLSRRYWWQKLATFWQSTAQQPSRRVALVVGAAILTLLICGTLVLKWHNPDSSWFHTFYVAGVMLLGSYDVVYGALSAQDSLPLWMRLMNLSYMLAGTASIAVLYALLTETLLAAKFQLPKKRPPLSADNHVVLVGLGRVGQRVATLLQQFRQGVVGVNSTPLEATILPQMPLVVGELTSSLSKTNLETARSAVFATDDEMTNLELALMAHRTNPNCALVIRTFDPRFSQNVARLLPYAKVLCVYDLAAQAFVAAAFGEHIHSLIRLNEQTVLVTEYAVTVGDTLVGRLLAEIAYGYGMVPILHQKPGEPARLMPSDDLQLGDGDRLVVLATITSLQRVERGDLQPRGTRVWIEVALSEDARFDGTTAIARMTHCSIAIARQTMENLPALLPVPLYSHQAKRLVRELGKCQVKASLAAGADFS